MSTSRPMSFSLVSNRICPLLSVLVFFKMLYLAICMKAPPFVPAFLMPPKLLIWLTTTFSLVSCLLKVFHPISFVSSSHGIRNSVCVFDGGVLSRTAFLLQMVSVKEEFCLLSCLLFIWMTSLWI